MRDDSHKVGSQQRWWDRHGERSPLGSCGRLGVWSDGAVLINASDKLSAERPAGASEVVEVVVETNVGEEHKGALRLGLGLGVVDAVAVPGPEITVPHGVNRPHRFPRTHHLSSCISWRSPRANLGIRRERAGQDVGDEGHKRCVVREPRDRHRSPLLLAPGVLLTWSVARF